MSDTQRWNDEEFLGIACEMIAREIDWDSIDSGRLHGSTSIGKTLLGEDVVIAVLSRPEFVATVLADADEERKHSKVTAETPLRLYVPAGMRVSVSDSRIVIREVANIAQVG